eukprot:TRINITY_DN41739_c0_g1_i1.p1 TRINITY_DN41739_c0_g1~~TRINITY_DN41739_c0_g1_i1.p1  ORF type:complete len:484 (+),score=67.40 TRINITY_DN41739_c0_g1_i1:262-1713(+)
MKKRKGPPAQKPSESISVHGDGDGLAPPVGWRPRSTRGTVMGAISVMVLLIGLAGWSALRGGSGRTLQEPTSRSFTTAISEGAVSNAATRLLEHLTEKGAVHALFSSTFEGGLEGIASRLPRKPGDLVLALPLDEVLFDQTVAPEVRAACEAFPCSATRAVLALGLAYERSLGEASRFAPFIRSLPSEIDNMVSWPLPLLKLTELALPGTQHYLSREMKELEGANKLMEAPVDVTDVIWAIGIVQSRAFGTWDGKEALIPGAGLINHHWNPEVAIPMPTCNVTSRRCFVLTGSRYIEEGEQIFFHYRPWSNLQLLIRYGFAVPENPWGPEVKFQPLENPPAWLVKAGCDASGIKLRASAGQEGLPLSDSVYRCAQAAFLANQSEEASIEAQNLWKAGAFNDDSGTAGVGRGLRASASRAIARACRESAAKWSSQHGLAILSEVAGDMYPLAKPLLRAVQSDLQLLSLCEENLDRLASEADAGS